MLSEFKKPSKTLEWEMMRLALADLITGPTASKQEVLGMWAEQICSGDYRYSLLRGFYPQGPRLEVCSKEEQVSVRAWGWLVSGKMEKEYNATRQF